MQPAVAVYGDRAALELLDIRLARSLLQERQQSLNSHHC